MCVLVYNSGLCPSLCLSVSVYLSASYYAWNKDESYLVHCQYLPCVESVLSGQDLDKMVPPDGSCGLATVVCDY